MTPASLVLRRSREETTPTTPIIRSGDVRLAWLHAFRDVRAETERRAGPLSAEDQAVQSMPDASPTKWHRAHTAWFFEQFLLVPHLAGYRAFDETFAYLFNSYYVAVGPRQARPARGLITRPDCQAVTAYRAHVDGREAPREREGFRLVSDRARARDRSSSRAAAPGVDPHRHPARLLHQSGLARL